MPPGTGAFNLAVNPVTNKIYAANLGFTAVIDGATNAVTSISGPGLSTFAVNAVTNRVYATDAMTGSLVVIDGSTNAVIATIPTGPNPNGVAVNQATNEIYVANSGAAHVTVVDGSTHAATNIPVVGFPMHVVVNEAANKAYVAAGIGPASNAVTVIDGATRATTTLQLGAGNLGPLDLNPVTGKVYRLQAPNVLVIDGATNALQLVPVPADASSILVNPLTNKIYVAAQSGLTVIDGATNATSGLAVPFGIPGRLRLNPATNVIYATSVNRPEISVIDGGTHAVRSFFVGLANGQGQRDVVVNPATNTLYTSLQVVGGVVVVPMGTRAVNLATRASVGIGDDRVITGFIIQGTTPKTVVVRARGPSLPGIATPLADPLLQLYSGQALIGENDNWPTAANAAELQASGFAPSDPAEAGVLVTLNPGAYTAVVSGAGAGTGTAIVEVFELGHSETPFTNISTRARVGTGEDVAIAGFVVQGGRPARVLVRGRGPSLAAAGLTGVLANPVLELVSSAGRIAVNDDWMQWPQKPEVEAFVVGEPHESMICMTLPPGAYTAIMTGAGGGTGIGIIEVFLLD